MHGRVVSMSAKTSTHWQHKDGIMKERIKVYIASKMAGLPGLGYNNFDVMEEKLKKKFDWQIINPASYTYDDDDKYTYHRVLYRDFKIIEKCDAIYMFGDWTDSPGAQCELAFARILGIDIMFENPEDASAIAYDMKSDVEIGDLTTGETDVKNETT